ncbi:MAG: hypothetical protein IPH66_16140 [Crocinitomicaceae bacterium]|nr:hypothetical protein [Crocinitomicaceae bacterium]
MLKKISITYALLALVTGLVTTFMQVQPALFFIDLLTGSDNKFPLKLVALLTVLVLMLPMLIVVVIVNLTTSGERDYLPNLTLKSGILVKREKNLSAAVYPFMVMINGEKKSAISNGKSTFVELIPGTYKVFIKTSGKNSAVLDIDVKEKEIIHLKSGYHTDTFKSSLYLMHDQEIDAV